MIERGERVPGSGPATERATIREFLVWFESNFNRHILVFDKDIEKYLYDQYMLGEEE